MRDESDDTPVTWTDISEPIPEKSTAKICSDLTLVALCIAVCILIIGIAVRLVVWMF